MARPIALIASLALLFAACCGSEEASETTTTTAPTTTTAEAPESQDGTGQLASIRVAISQSAEITSGRMEGLIEVRGAIDGGTVMDLSMPFGGTFDTVTGNSSFFIDLSGIAEAGGEEIPAEFADMFGEMEVRMVDGVSYIKFPFFALLFAAETDWISAPAEEGSDLMNDFTFAQPDNPAEILRELEDADAEVTEVGRETVNGIETTHYRVVFDTATLLAEMPAEERAELEERGPIPDGEFPMDLWISDDGLIIRYIMDIDGSTVPATDGDRFDRMVMTFNLFDINEPVDIVAPDAAEVSDIESLGGFFGVSEG